MVKYTEVEVYILVDNEGQWVAHEDESELGNRWDESIGGMPAGLRTVKVVVKVPLPEMLEARGEVAAVDESAAVVSAE